VHIAEKVAKFGLSVFRLPAVYEGKDRHDLVQISERAGNPEPISKALAVAFTKSQIHAR